MISRHDKILIGIAASLLGGVVLGLVTTLQFHIGIFFGALVATVFVYDAMFRNPPLPTGQPKRMAAAIVWHAVLFVLALAVYFG
ncbi:hypothetical protein CV102_22150 [Natronococcus pandeyae]|uniref:Uncharacterized protein n=1 Tax=Natronococcus pandeyae TaxID=2055836 RepID=A0A8J8PZI5_9EURY|nr:hypothetical protein [Natronococcus pandeyae]TYL36527.1 hypothetical protein CV102_22150 [Natronococcus pandeyae]